MLIDVEGVVHCPPAGSDPPELHAQLWTRERLLTLIRSCSGYSRAQQPTRRPFSFSLAGYVPAVSPLSRRNKATGSHPLPSSPDCSRVANVLRMCGFGGETGYINITAFSPRKQGFVFTNSSSCELHSIWEAQRLGTWELKGTPSAQGLPPPPRGFMSVAGV